MEKEEEVLQQMGFANLSYLDEKINDITTEEDGKKILQENLLSIYAENDENTQVLINKGVYKNIEGIELIDSVDHPDTGLGAMAFKDSNGNISIAYTGTQFGKDTGDVLADAMITLSCNEVNQYKGAIEFTERILNEYSPKDGYSYTLTGHSLGGGLIQAMVVHCDSLGYDVKGVGFEAVGSGQTVLSKMMSQNK